MKKNSILHLSILVGILMSINTAAFGATRIVVCEEAYKSK